MSNLFQIARLGMGAYQRAIAMTSNNLSNLGNRSYSRQMANFSALPSQRFGNSFIGTGVSLSSIQRISNEYAVRNVRETTSVKSQYDSFLQQATQVDKLLSQDGNSISVSLQQFFTALSQLNENPASTSSRTTFLKQTESLVIQYGNMQSQLDGIQTNNTAQIRESVNKMNALAGELANVNSQLLGEPDAPELLDHRDELLRQLSEFAELTVNYDATGAATVSLGSGQNLVIGSQRSTLSVRTTDTGETGSVIELGNEASRVDITSRIRSGSIGGLLEFERTTLQQADRLLGKMAIGLSETFNAQHHMGVDLNGQYGKDFFTDFNSATLQLARAKAHASNAGTATMSVAISDVSQLQASDYDVIVTDAATFEVQITRRSDGQVTTTNFTNTPPAPPAGQIVMDGLTIQVDDVGNLADTDRFTLLPTRGAAGNVTLLVNQPSEVALAAPVRTQEVTSNNGTGAIRLGDVFDTVNTGKSFRIQFLSPTQYNVINETDAITTGPFAFTPSSDNTIMIPDSVSPSYSVVLSGIPQTGDEFTAAFNAGGVGDNWNGVKLNDISRASIFSNGTETLFNSYANLLVDVGSKTHLALISSQAAEILNNNAQDVQDGLSGVNLDEELINLQSFQEAYQASAQIVSVANNLINILFDVLG